MPTCRKCGGSFPNRIIVEGKPHILNSRKFCLTCSPFGLHNTKNLMLRAAIDPNGEKRCPRCKDILPIAMFYAKRSGQGVTSYCRKCVSDQTLERSHRLKERSVAYKGGKCVVCGYDKCLAALDFHHLDDTKKDFSIAACKLSNFEKVRVELNKCILVCSNCHREIHSGLTAVPNGTPRSDYYNEPHHPEGVEPPLRNFCCDCGKVLKNHTAIRCRKCHLMRQEVVEWPSTEILLDMVRRSSFLAVAKQLGVSDNAIRHRIQNHPVVQISIPPVGFEPT
jgi:hypothetical protein